MFEKNSQLLSQELYLDACRTGMGAVWRNRVFATHIYEIPGFEHTITHLEMLNFVRSNKTRDNFLALFIGNIWLLAACYDTNLKEIL